MESESNQNKISLENEKIKEDILNMLKVKSVIKQNVFDNTFESFTMLKNILHELVNSLNDELVGIDKRVKLEYKDRGKFEAEARLAEDILVFSMHTNIFEFNRDHLIWKTSYIKDNPDNSFCGVISIYNFLSDSFKHNRTEDLGYLVGRIFVNKEMHYFVEGKRQMHFLNNFDTQVVTEGNMELILQKAMHYALEFDLLIPPYDLVKIVTVDQLNTKIQSTKMQTGKRLGFKFNADDILGIE